MPNHYYLSKIHSYLTMEHRSLFYKAYIQPHINYCNIVWGNSSNYNVSQITKLQRRVCKIILGTEYSDLDSARRRLDILSFDQNVLVNKAKIMYKVVHDMFPQYIKDLFISYERTRYLIPHYDLSRVRIFISQNLISACLKIVYHTLDQLYGTQFHRKLRIRHRVILLLGMLLNGLQTNNSFHELDIPPPQICIVNIIFV